MQEMRVPSLGWEDPLEKEVATTHSSILVWEFHGQRSLAGYSPQDCRESNVTSWLNNNNNSQHGQRIQNVQKDGHYNRNGSSNQERSVPEARVQRRRWVLTLDEGFLPTFRHSECGTGLGQVPNTAMNKSTTLLSEKYWFGTVESCFSQLLWIFVCMSSKCSNPQEEFFPFTSPTCTQGRRADIKCKQPWLGSPPSTESAGKTEPGLRVGSLITQSVSATATSDTGAINRMALKLTQVRRLSAGGTLAIQWVHWWEQLKALGETTMYTPFSVPGSSLCM